MKAPPPLPLSRRPSRKATSVTSNLDNIKRIGGRVYLSDAYFHLLRSRAVFLVVFWIVWWLLSAAVLAGMLWGTLREGVDYMTEPSLEPIETYTQFWVTMLLFIVDSDTPYVWGDRMKTAMLFCGLWKMITLACFIAVFIDKLSAPRLRLRWSSRALVTYLDGKPVFMFRVAQEKNSVITDAEMRLHVIADYVTPEGWKGRRSLELPLTRSKVPLLSLSWQLSHVITPDSPMFPFLALLDPSVSSPMERSESKKLVGGENAPLVHDIEIMAFFTGEDSTQRESIKTWRTYTFDDVQIGGRFADVIQVPKAIDELQPAVGWRRLLPSHWLRPHTGFVLNLNKYDDILPISATPTAAVATPSGTERSSTSVASPRSQ